MRDLSQLYRAASGTPGQAVISRDNPGKSGAVGNYGLGPPVQDVWVHARSRSFGMSRSAHVHEIHYVMRSCLAALALA